MAVRSYRLLAALCAATALFVTTTAQAQRSCEPVVGEFVSIEGQVEVQGLDSSDWLGASLSDPLCEGDTLRVGSDSRAAISLINEAVLRLDERTTLRLVDITPEEEERSFFDLVSGVFQSFSRKPRFVAVNTPYLNASIEGTEFVMTAAAEESSITVLEGLVRASNPQGEVQVAAGEAAIAQAGQAPRSEIVVRPRDAVQWAIYYPPILTEADAAAPAQLTQAARQLDVGQVEAARASIEQVLAQNPDSGLALALRSIIETVQNEREAALADAQGAVELNPDTAATWIALSYAQQAQFQLEAARETLLSATEANPDAALAWARLAEIELALTNRRKAREAAERAVEISPDLERTQVVLGFANLVEIRTKAAREAFERAIELDSEDPLPRFGLGLAQIRDGELHKGRNNISIAVALDSNSSLLRSYLGKAYFEEKRNELASEQYDVAKELDPLDPTPWLYSAIQKQTENRPVEALEDLQRSIELNDNRAVYRSREALDADRAARGASLATIYTDLGFEPLGVNEATKSITVAPDNASAHRFLSDSYQGVRRREIARVSELLQAQMLQDLNVNPIQPSTSVANLNTISGGGFEAGLNEFTPLFERNQVQLNGTALFGNNDTLGGEGVLSGIYEQFSLSAAGYHYNTDGWRDNNDIKHNIFDIYGQVAVTPELNVQAEYRHRETEFGDLAFDFDPDDFSENAQNKEDEDIARFGVRYSPAPHSDVLFSYIYNHREAVGQDEFTEFLEIAPGVIIPLEIGVDNPLESDTNQVEGQYIFRQDWYNVIVGAAYNHIDGDEAISLTFDGVPGFEDSIPFDSDDYRVYAYTNINFPEDVTWTLGLSYVDFTEKREGVPDKTVDRFNPKVGVQWDVTSDVTLRAAYAENVKPSLAANRTLEPTQVAGFNQLFDDSNATRSRRYGFGADWNILNGLSIGGEATWRKIEEDFIDGISAPTPLIVEDEAKEQFHRIYAFWTPTNEIAVGASLSYDKWKKESDAFAERVFDQNPLEVKTLTAGLDIRYFHHSGFFAGAGVSYVDQDVRRLPDFPNQGDDQFALVDVGVGFRFPNRMGFVTLQINNLFDKNFRYQDDSWREFSVDPSIGPYFPERTILGRLTLNF